MWSKFSPLYRLKGNMIEKLAIKFLVLTALCGCAAQSNKFGSEARYIGHFEKIVQGKNSLAALGTLSSFASFKQQAEVSKQALGDSWISSRVILIEGVGQALTTLEIPSGSLESRYGQTVELIFLIQPCRVIEIQKQIRCTDLPLLPSMRAQKQIVLKGGERITASFSNDLHWTYEVLDQSSPFISGE